MVLPARFTLWLTMSISRSANLQQLAGQRRPHPAQHRPHPGDQLARGERLGHIIVGAGLEAAHPVRLLAAAGQHDDRHVGGLGRAADAAADFEAGNALDHPVEQDDVGRRLGGEQQRLVAVGRMRRRGNPRARNAISADRRARDRPRPAAAVPFIIRAGPLPSLAARAVCRGSVIGAFGRFRDERCDSSAYLSRAPSPVARKAWSSGSV